MTDTSVCAAKWYYFIDGLRGFSLLNMLMFHFYYDVFMIFGQNTGWYSQPLIHIWQQYICISFLFISGISWHFSKNNKKRGILLNVYGMLITAVTLLVMPSQVVWFGILNCIGCATLLMEPLHYLFLHLKLRIHPAKRKAGILIDLTGFFVSILLFLISRPINEGYLWLFGYHVSLPGILYQIRPLTILGFPYPGFYSSDYFSILPWFFVFLSGYWFWASIQHSRRILNLFTIRIPVFSRLGKNTIWYYLLHQPILYVAAYFLHPFL